MKNGKEQDLWRIRIKFAELKKMRHEKIIKRPDGSRVRITVTLDTESYKTTARWGFMCDVCEKGKRTWTTPVNRDDYSWRRLSAEDRIAENKRRCLTLASEEEVLEVMQELMALIKPSIY